MSGAVILAGGGSTPPEVPQTMLRQAGGGEGEPHPDPASGVPDLRDLRPLLEWL